MRKSVLFLVFIMCFIYSKTHAQHTEIGVFLGSSYYIGDLNPNNHFLNKINPAAGILYRKNLSKRYSLRYAINFGYISATDEKNGAEWNNYRNISFSSTLIDASGLLEFNFLPYQINNYNTAPFTPFIFIGVAAFRVAPEVKNNSTNLTIKSKELIAPSIPFGFGLKFNFIRNLGLNIEWSLRKTFTDEIDGLSPTYANGLQLTNAQNNDWYSFAGITLNYKILTKSDHCPVVK